jgi:Skp family chaperone for outer membrane proteins
MRTASAVVAGLAVVAALGASLAPLLPAAPVRAAEGETVAVVDLDRILEAAPRGKRFLEEAKKKHEERMDALKKAQEEVEKQIQDLEALLDPASAAYAAKRKEAFLRLTEIEFDRKAEVARVKVDQVKELAAVYKDACAVIARVAEKRGVGCVLRIANDPITVEEGGQVLDLAGLRYQMGTRAALYAKPGLDLTAEVVAEMAK